MKREELTPIELECNMGPDVNGVVQREPWKAYDIDEVNRLLDEMDAEIAALKKKLMPCLNGDCILTCDTVEKYGKENASLKAKLENVQASAYADSVDAGMRERRLRRALWLARALRARDIQRWWIAATCAPITERACSVWNNVERNCLEKAEEYK